MADVDAGEHEGYLECVFADGYAGEGWSDGAVLISVAPDGAAVPRDQRASRTPGEVVGWRIVCDCGGIPRRWVSELWVRVPSSSLEDLAAGRIHSSDDQTWRIDERDDVNAAAEELWATQHVQPLAAVDELKAARQELLKASRRLDAAVAEARRTDLSWATIGSAVDISRQAAHQRWATLDTSV